MNVTASQIRQDFNNFKVSNANNYMPFMTTSAPMVTSTKVPTSDLVRNFKHGIKHDISQFTTLEDDAMWDNWNRSTTAQARAQDIADILDPILFH